MLRDLLSSRWFQGSLVFCLLCIGGSLLYHWHVVHTTEREMEHHDRFLLGLQKQKETRPAVAVNVPTENETPGLVNTPEENSDTPMPEETEALPNETENLDVTDAFLPDDFVSEEETHAEEVAVSPYGFGPYPEVPADFPGTPIWERDSWQHEGPLGFSDHQRKNFELLSRVLVKLWVEQGVGSYLGGAVSHETGHVYPYVENTIYVKRTVSRNPDGTEGVAVAEVMTPGNLSLTGEEMDGFRETGETPPGLQVLQIDTDGIDPYEFLNLQR